MMRILFILIIIAVFNACFAASKTATQWRGVSADELVKKMGTPNVVNTAPDGTKTYVYVTPTYQSYPSPPTGVPAVNVSGRVPVIVNPTPVPNSPRSVMTCTLIFTVNKQNIVTKVQKDGAGCP